MPLTSRAKYLFRRSPELLASGQERRGVLFGDLSRCAGIRVPRFFDDGRRDRPSMRPWEKGKRDSEISLILRLEVRLLMTKG